jgi:hypothetical protein
MFARTQAKIETIVGGFESLGMDLEEKTTWLAFLAFSFGDTPIHIQRLSFFKRVLSKE